MTEKIFSNLPKDEKSEISEYEWIQLRKEMDAFGNSGNQSNDSEKSKNILLKRFQKNPIIAVGSLATIGFLTYGLISFRRKDSATSQYMMRGRIFAQSFTIVAFLAGIIYDVKIRGNKRH